MYHGWFVRLAGHKNGLRALGMLALFCSAF
jgi:hypothetical protein